HAVADEAAHVLPQDARRDQRQDGLAPADHERVAGVVTALKASDGSRTLGQEVDDLALALIAPLRPDDDDELAHGGGSLQRTRYSSTSPTSMLPSPAMRSSRSPISSMRASARF